MTTAQIVALVVQAGLLLVGGVLGLLIRGVSAKIDGLAKAVEKLRDEVAEQGKALAGGAQRFQDIERRLGEVEGRVERIQTKGCARVSVCAEA